MGAGSTDVIDPGVGAPAETPEWLASLPEDLRGAKSLARYADIPALAKGHVELESRLGAPLKPPALPAKDAPADVQAKYQADAARYRARIGAPETADKYAITKPEGLPASMTWDDEVVTGFKTLAHSIGLTQEQVTALTDFDTQRQLGMVDRATGSLAASRAAAEAALKQAWGPQVYARNAGLAKQALDHFAPDAEVKALIEDSAFGNDPRVIKLFHAIGEALLEDGEITGTPAMGESQVQAKIDAMRNDAKHPLNDPNHPGNKAAVDELYRLLQQLPGGKDELFATTRER